MIPDASMCYTQAETQTSYFDKSHITSNHYDKVTIDSMIPDVSTFYNKTELNTLLYTKYPSISSIDLTLQSYLTSTQIEDPYYSKSEIDTTLSLYSPSAQILNNLHSKLYIDNMFLTSAQIGALYYTKTDTDNLLANKVSTTGDVSLSGNLDVGSGSSSAINVHAANNGYTGYAELKAQSSYDMYLNLETTRVNGGWVYFQINGNNYGQSADQDPPILEFESRGSYSLCVDFWKVHTCKIRSGPV